MSRNRRPLVSLGAALWIVAGACSRPLDSKPKTGPLRSDPVAGWRWRAKVPVAGALVTNGLGLADRPRSRLPAPGRLRILLVGDEQLLMPAVPELTLPRLTEHALQSMDGQRDWELLNLGVVGYGPAQMGGLLASLGLELSPAAVVVVFNLMNDLLQPRIQPQPRDRPSSRTLPAAAIVPDPMTDWPLGAGAPRTGLWYGWAASEPNGIWIQGREAAIGMVAESGGDLTIGVEASPLILKNMLPQSLELRINGRSLGARDLKLGSWLWQRWRAPAAWLRPDINALVLRARWSRSPNEAGINPDLRQLSVQLRRLRFSRPVRLVPAQAADPIAGRLVRMFPPPASGPSGAARRLEPFARLESPALAQAWQETWLELDRIHEILRRRNVPWILALLPDPLQLEPAKYSAVLRRWQLAPEAFDLERPQRRLRDWAESHRVPFLDLGPALKSSAAATDQWDESCQCWTYGPRLRAAERIAAMLPASLRAP